MESVERNRLFSTASLLPAMSGFRIIHIVNAVAARLLNRVLSSVKERELRLSPGAMNTASSDITGSNGGICAERSRTKADDQIIKVN
jgi:hypothetical protein